MGNLVSVLYLAAFLFAGLILSKAAAPKLDPLARGLFGVTCGLFLLLWLPALCSFMFGFTLLSQILALLLCLAPAALLLILRKGSLKAPFFEGEINLPELKLFCAVVLPLLLLCIYLLHTHILLNVGGVLHTGQSGYGDVPMHLSIITSIARNGIFPPNYSIQAGSPMGYPFLCDSVSSTFLLLGASLRFAYILPMLPALLCVFGWAFLLFSRWLKSPYKACAACAVFFLGGGGFGIFYFLDGAKADPGVFTRMFTAFYETPANDVAQNIVWVNPIADMLIPQRATLFGWSILFCCLFLLYHAAFEGQKRLFLPLAVLAGGLPLIHTHSFLSIAVLSLFAMLYGLFMDRRSLRQYLFYALAAAALALPQLLRFTFSQLSPGAFLTPHFNWVNQADPYLWFYIKNMGLIFLLLPFAFAFSGKKRWFAACSLPIWLLAEFILFQPNAYDNNKLIFIPYLLCCGLVIELLSLGLKKLNGAAVRLVAGALVLFLMTVSGVLSLAREAVSDYVLFDQNQVAAAEFVKDKLPKSSVFLTADEHNNSIAALAGATIVQGSPSYLFFHGIYDQARAADVRLMFTQPGKLQELSPKYGVTHVVLSAYERGFGADESLFEGLPIAYQNAEITIYSLP